uniref:Uncharacterized protein n=1 Tax=Hyaloperonospora arabidopsidis (strain Emoy2) TaxID=559515 RepID=M4BI14_HYAAE
MQTKHCERLTWKGASASRSCSPRIFKFYRAQCLECDQAHFLQHCGHRRRGQKIAIRYLLATFCLLFRIVSGTNLKRVITMEVVLHIPAKCANGYMYELRYL